MGLDMYAYKVPPSNILNEFNFVNKNGHDWYWRKNRHLHNWMESLWEYKGGGIDREKFNMESIRLDKNDLLQLRQDIMNNELDDTGGFFFGDNDYTDDMKEYDLKFVKEALKAIDKGYAIYYDSWW